MITTVSAAVRDFVLDDFQETVWYDGVLPCPPAEELAPYFPQFLADCEDIGRPVPDGLTPEIYHSIWMEEYERRITNE